MHTLSVSLAVAMLAAAPALATEKTDVLLPVYQFVDSFNKGDTTTAAAACAEQTSIIDEFPPYAWHGRGACATWMSDYDADAKKNEISEGMVALNKPRHVDIDGDRAYVVVPASYAFTKKGSPVKETLSTLTVALENGEKGWRITAWAWTKN